MDIAIADRQPRRMEQLAAIYERKGTVFVLASHKTKAGFWVDDEVVESLSRPTAEELGGAVEAALARSQHDVPTPPPSARLDKPLLLAAGVTSWPTFMKLSKHISVSLGGGGYKITPYRNLGSKEGFEPQSRVFGPPPSSPTALGDMLLSLLAETV